MKKLSILLFLAALPAYGSETPKYNAIDELQEKANSYIATLEAQRNTALNQVVALTAELEKMKKAKECKAK